MDASYQMHYACQRRCQGHTWYMSFTQPQLKVEQCRIGHQHQLANTKGMLARGQKTFSERRPQLWQPKEGNFDVQLRMSVDPERLPP
jgi:hypothetical protein